MALRLSEPAASRRSLVISAGVTWMIGAVVLLVRSIELAGPSLSDFILPAIIGIVVGYLKYRFVFLKVVNRNVVRIIELAPHKEKVCIFAFQPLQSYFLLIVMVGVGIALRMTPIPSKILAAIYLAISTALVLSGLLYLRRAKDI